MNFKQLTGELFRGSRIVLGILLMIDLGATFAETKPQNKPLNLTANNLTIPENFSSSNLPETFSAEHSITIDPNLTISENNVLDTDEDKEAKLLIFSYKATESIEKKDVLENNLISNQEKILAILETRFENIPDLLVKQVNQVSDPLFLEQLHQIAEVTSSPEAFQNALTSMEIKEENITPAIANYYIASDLYQEKDIKLLAQTQEKYPFKEKSETPNSKTETEKEATTEKPQKMVSIMDVAPQVLMMMRKSSLAFGAPTTVVENFGSNTQLTADWGESRRSESAEDGVFFEVYSTTIPQGVVSGGNNENSAISENLDAYFNLDTGRLGLWPGGLFQLTVQSKFGSNINADAGSIAPVNSVVEWPIPGIDNVGAVSEYALLQSFSPEVLFVIGKINPVAYADTNVFANNYRYQFQNFALNNNLMLGTYAPLSTWAAGVVWQPNPWFHVLTAVFDPNASAQNFVDDFFKDVVIFQEFDFAYKIAERPGNFRLAWVLNTKDGVDLEDPLNFRTFRGRPIINFRSPINKRDSSFAFTLNFDQYLFTIDPSATDEYHQRSETS